MKKTNDTLPIIFVVILALAGSYIVKSSDTLIHCLGLFMIMFPIGAYGYYEGYTEGQKDENENKG